MVVQMLPTSRPLDSNWRMLACTPKGRTPLIGALMFRDRLHRLYGEQHGFEIHNPQEGGLLVAVQVPVRSCRA